MCTLLSVLIPPKESAKRLEQTSQAIMTKNSKHSLDKRSVLLHRAQGRRHAGSELHGRGLEP